MKVVITGASGFVGKHVVSLMAKQQIQDIVTLTRQDFLPESDDVLIQKLKYADVVINLAGAPIARRWTDSVKQEIYDSRIITTRVLVNAINRLDKKPELFISTSAIGIYPDNELVDETQKELGTTFLSKVCMDWEHEALQISGDVRTVITRFAVILGSEGGMLPKLAAPFRYGLGARIGKGDQPFAWIHIYDLMQIFEKVISTPQLSGIVNCVAPDIADNKQLTQCIAMIERRKARLVIPPLVIKWMWGEGAQLLLSGQCVKSKVLPEIGFKFSYPLLPSALRSLLG